MEQAARWLDGFETAIAALSDNPLQHALACETNRFQLEIPARQINYGLGSGRRIARCSKFAGIPSMSSQFGTWRKTIFRK